MSEGDQYVGKKVSEYNNCIGCEMVGRQAPICGLCIRNSSHADYYARKTRFDVVPNLRLRKRKVRVDKIQQPTDNMEDKS